MKVKVGTGNSLKVEAVRAECGTARGLSREERKASQEEQHQKETQFGAYVA